MCFARLSAIDFSKRKTQQNQCNRFVAQVLSSAPHGIVNDAVASGYHFGRDGCFRKMLPPTRTWFVGRL
jgi:hypothetical protein